MSGTLLGGLGRRHVRIAAFTLWGLAAIVVFEKRPGELLELAIIGIAGAILLANTTVWQSRALLLTALAGFAAPLENVWPVRVFDLAAGHVPVIPQVAGNVPTLLLIAVLALPEGRRALLHAPRVLQGAALLLILGGFASTLMATDHRSAFQSWIVGLVVPALWGLVAAAVVRDAATGWAVLGTAVVAALVPLYVAIAAYALQFGFPDSGNTLLLHKFALERPHLIQDAVLGNVGHLADLAVMLLPAAVLVLSTRVATHLQRLACIACGIGIALVLVLVLERLEIMLAGIALLAVTAVALVGRRRAVAALSVGLLAILLVGTLNPPVGRYVTSVFGVSASLPAATAPPLPPLGGSVTVPASPSVNLGTVTTTDTSATVRASAVSQGFRIFEKHPLGVGPGQYERYDTVHTAAHSLPVQLLAEDGPLTLAGFIVLVAAVGLAFVRTLRSAVADGLRADTTVALAATGGASIFLLQATAGGSLLSVGAMNLWGVLLWLQAGLGVALTARART